MIEQLTDDNIVIADKFHGNETIFSKKTKLNAKAQG